MHGDIVYRVYGLHEGREEDFYFGAFRSRSEADAQIAKLYAMKMDGRNWAKQYHNKGFVVRETVVTFVWGCQWGDDSSWKVQYLDLSRVQQGVVRREERFEYLELATFGFENPCFRPDAPIQNSAPPPFIKVSRHKGVTQVRFAVEMIFDLESGESQEWQRLKIANFE